MIVVSGHDTLDSEHDTCVSFALAQLDSKHGKPDADVVPVSSSRLKQVETNAQVGERATGKVLNDVAR